MNVSNNQKCLFLFLLTSLLSSAFRNVQVSVPYTRGDTTHHRHHILSARLIFLLQSDLNFDQCIFCNFKAGSYILCGLPLLCTMSQDIFIGLLFSFKCQQYSDLPICNFVFLFRIKEIDFFPFENQQ